MQPDVQLLGMLLHVYARIDTGVIGGFSGRSQCQHKLINFFKVMVGCRLNCPQIIAELWCPPPQKKTDSKFINHLSLTYVAKNLSCLVLIHVQEYHPRIIDLDLEVRTESLE